MTDAPPSARPCLLIIEDEQSLLRAFAHAFERKGYEVLTAVDVPSAQAHWRARTHGIACIVSDVQMPGPPLEVLIEEIRAHEPRVPILLMSGELRGSEDRIRGLMANVDGFLAKPLRLDMLRSEIERLIGPRG
ncbi:MAG: response regulator [Gemmatimonadaceae bacterium]|nr:response regulator [Gemmatimonadaceae bacterium]